MRAAHLTCPLLEIRSLASSAESEEEVLRAAGPHRQAQPSLITSAASQQEVTVLALGPVLDSLDAREIEVDPSCTADGATIVATIMHYSGGVKKNVLWRPRIRIVITPRRPEVRFKATWRMRGVEGAGLGRVGAQRYPVTVTTTIRSH